MPQMQLPVFCDRVTAITNDVGYQKIENTVVYFYGTLPVFSHALEDMDSFRMIVSQLYVNGSVPQIVLARVFQIKPLALKRWVNKYREEGPSSFFKSRKGGSRARVLTAEVLEKVQARLDAGYTINEISRELTLSYDVLRKTLTVEVHAMSTPKEDAALEHLCAELTETQTKYPGTELVYKKVSLSVP